MPGHSPQQFTRDTKQLTVDPAAQGASESENARAEKHETCWLGNSCHTYVVEIIPGRLVLETKRQVRTAARSGYQESHFCPVVAAGQIFKVNAIAVVISNAWIRPPNLEHLSRFVTDPERQFVRSAGDSDDLLTEEAEGIDWTVPGAVRAGMCAPGANARNRSISGLDPAAEITGLESTIGDEISRHGIAGAGSRRSRDRHHG